MVCENIFLAPPRPNVEDGAFSHKIDYVTSYGDFAEWMDFAYWWSCIEEGLRLQPAQQACFSLITHDK